MLRRLTIRDFVIVDRLELDFGAGFGTLTGETGAGKSILLDALGLALGGRADAASVRTGRDKADITAEFDLPDEGPLAQLLEGFDIPLEEGLVLLRRVVEAGGRSRAWINGVPATLAQLRETGEYLADIHGQHAHHALLRQDAQRALVDAHAGARELAGEVAALYRAWLKMSQRRNEAERDSAAAERQREMLEWQLEEITQLAFDSREWDELNAEQSRLAHAASLIEGAEASLALLAEGEVTITAMLQSLNARVEAMAEIDPAVEEARELVAGAAIQADEALHAMRRYRDRLDLDPGRLAELDRRIGAIMDVARKHRVQPEDLPDLRARWADELAELTERADPARLAQLETEAHEAYLVAARKLSARRKPAAAALSREVTEAMQGLAMTGGCFEVALVADESGSANGLEQIEFRVAANPNQPLRSLAKVASGGELSRIGLAIQVMTSRESATPTLIFDEVDVGIGGGVAEIVGTMLSRLGRDRQVLCVTHLPQVAACADWQWRISKQQVDEGVISRVVELDDEERIEEVARMLGGVNITATTRSHAAEMLRRESV
ncbi:DNA repair protein RecN [Azoarcus taiwanensis]|uniref:DNA repair protein RecN n=1 Tax=Azoarcus taiwanensis TaxID=666964 RepID=A0A972F8B8_9RHOO|nr:DNA repair protein RecN [Azoarcus taiwanensis]NMG03440.1 DNA repair protein RecN [Azoarcus taiwanensis]